MPRKQINKGLVVSLSLILFVVTVVVSALTFRRLQQRDPEYFVALAQRYADREDWATASIFYQRAWERSKDSRHLVSLGNAQLAQGKVRRALAGWRAALINQPDLPEAHRQYLKALLELGRLYDRLDTWKTVGDAARAFLDSGAAQSPQERAFAQHARGLAAIQRASVDSGSLEAGEAALRDAIQLAPNSTEYAVDLVKHLTSENRADQAENTLERLMDRVGDSPVELAKAYIAQGDFLSTQGRFNEAQRAYQTSLKQSASDRETLLHARIAYARFLKNSWLRSRRSSTEDEKQTASLFAQAESLLNTCIADDAESYDPYFLLVDLYGTSERFADAVATCEARLDLGLVRTGFKAESNRINTVRLMLTASRASVALGEAAKSAEESEKETQWLVQATAFVADARSELPGLPSVLDQSGRVKLAKSQLREALIDLRAASDGFKTIGRIDWGNRVLLAQTHLRLDEPGAARDVLAEVLTAARRQRIGPGFWLLYAQVLFRLDEPNSALSIVEQVLVSMPANTDALKLKAAIYEGLGRPGDASSVMQTLGGDPGIRALLESQEFALRGETGRSIATLLEALEANPADARVVSAAVRQLVALGRDQEAQTLVERALATDPENVRLRTMAVFARGDLPQAQRDRQLIEIIETIEDPYQRHLEAVSYHLHRHDLPRLLEHVNSALAHLEAKDTALAKKATLAQHLALLSAKVTAAAELGDMNLADGARAAAARYNVDGAGGKSIVGLYHFFEKQYDLAISAFREVVDLHPTDTDALTHLGQCLQMSERRAEAKTMYQRAIRINPSAGLAIKGLATLAKAEGDTDAFDRHLAASAKLLPNDPWIREALLIQQEQQDPATAITQREARRTEDPENLRNLYRLTSLYETDGQIEKSDELFDELIERLPDDNGVIVQAAAYYRRTDRPGKSLTLVERYASTRLTTIEKADARILVASHYIHVGDDARVEETLLQAAKLSETLNVLHSLGEFYMHRVDQPQRARPWLEKGVAKARAEKSSRTPDFIANLISSLLHRKINDIAEAQIQIADLRTTFPNDRQGAILEAEVLARQGEIDQAIDTLTDYLSNRKDDVTALYQRALHHRAQGRTSDAIRDLETIRANRSPALGERPRLLLAELYGQAGRLDDRERELEMLLEDDPESITAIRLLIGLHIAREQFEQADARVTRQINRSDDESSAPWFTLRGRIAEARGDASAALAAFEDAARVGGEKIPDVRRVIDTLIRQARTSEGLDYCRQRAPLVDASGILRSGCARLKSLAGQTSNAIREFRFAMGDVVVGSEDAQTITLDILASFEAAQSAKLFTDPPPSADMAIANDRILARLYAATRRHMEADRLLTRLADGSTETDRATFLRDLGNVRQNAGRAEPARQAYEESLTYDPDNWITHNNLAYLLADSLGEHEAARLHAERAVSVVQTRETLDTLGWIYVGLGQYPRAIAELNNAARLDASYPLVYYHLGEAYRRHGHFERATAVLKSGSMISAQADPDLSTRLEESLQRAKDADATP